MATVDARKDDDYDDDSISSSDSDDDGRPPPMIQIEKSADLGTLKSALLTMKDKAPEKKEIEERLGKDTLSNITKGFEQPRDPSPKAEKEKIDVGDKEQYSSFKKKFEHIDKELVKQEEERRAQASKEVEGIGAEILAQAKVMFEKGQDTNGPGAGTRPIEIERSDEARKRVKDTFVESSEKEEPRDCAICGKMVYSVEKVQAEKRVFHKACFKCNKCQKTLSVRDYGSHEGKIYCKLHIKEIYRPEGVGLAHEGAVDADTEEPDDDEEYAVVAKPKVLDASVIRSGLKSNEDLENVPKLQNAKAKWAESAEQTSKVEKRSGMEADLIQQGKVKSRLTKFAEGGEGDEEPEDEEDEAVRDPNIIRSTKKKEAVHVEVGAKTIKSKWEAGTMEKAQNELQDRSQELDEVKKNVSVKERFKERTGEEVDESAAQRSSILENEPLDTSFTKTAKERFQKGEAFQDTTPVEKTAIDARCAELGNIKAAFEAPKGEDEVTGEKRKQIQAEFERIKSERIAIKEKEQAEGADAADGQTAKSADDVRQSADMGSIKKRFEEGTAFQTTSEKKADEQLEIKVAGKAREKFRQIDQEAPKEPVISQSSRQEPSKWAKEKGVAPEPINRRVVADETGVEEPEEFEVKNLLNKFKNIAEGGGKEKDVASLTAEELAAIKVESKNLKEKFEKVGKELTEEQSADEKKKLLEDEFKRIKEMKESQKPDEPEPEEPEDESNPDLAVAAEHAQKARAKWDKIQRKEAKKAQKAATLSSKGTSKAKDETS